MEIEWNVYIDKEMSYEIGNIENSILEYNVKLYIVVKIV